MKVKKHVFIPLALLVYVIAMAIYFIPKSTDSDVMKVVEVGGSLALVVLLYFVLRRRERLRQERLDDMKKVEEEKKNKNINNKP